MRKLARGNSRLLWRTVDEEFWSRYARETLPAIVEQRAKAMEEKLEKARASKRKTRAQSDLIASKQMEGRLKKAAEQILQENPFGL